MCVLRLERGVLLGNVTLSASGGLGRGSGEKGGERLCIVRVYFVPQKVSSVLNGCTKMAMNHTRVVGPHSRKKFSFSRGDVTVENFSGLVYISHNGESLGKKSSPS